MQNIIIISGASGWSLGATGFTNPSYISAPNDPNDAFGFDIAAGGAVSIAFTGTYTGQTVVHQQTLDPTGNTGWFPVYGISSGTTETVGTGGSTSGTNYLFPAAGIRHRIQVTALSTGTITAVIGLLSYPVAEVTTAGGGGGTSSNASVGTNGAAAPGSSTQIGVNVGGNLQPASASNPVPISAAATLSTQPYPTTPVSGAITTAMTGTTSTSLVAAPGAALHNYITCIIVSNSSTSVATDVIIQDGSGGTTLMTIPAAINQGGAVVALPTPLKQPTANAALFCANVTTGSSTKVSAVGFTAA